MHPGPAVALALAFHVLRASGATVDVAVEPYEGGGTMHFAERVTFRGTSGPALVVSTHDDEKGGDLVPLFGREMALPGDPSAVLLLGWSSTGSGMETVHAWIVRAASHRAPVIVAKLAWTTDRASAGFIVDLSQGVRVGVPWTFDGPMHDASEWALEIGTRPLALVDVKGLTFQPTTANYDSYCPPFGAPAWPAATRVFWIVATPFGFQMR